MSSLVTTLAFPRSTISIEGIPLFHFENAFLAKEAPRLTRFYIGRGTSQNVRRRSAHRSWFCSWFTGKTFFGVQSTVDVAAHLGTIRWQKSWFDAANTGSFGLWCFLPRIVDSQVQQDKNLSRHSRPKRPIQRGPDSNSHTMIPSGINIRIVAAVKAHIDFVCLNCTSRFKSTANPST